MALWKNEIDAKAYWRRGAYGDPMFWATYGLWAVVASRGLMRWGSGAGMRELGLMAVALATPLGAAVAEIYRRRRIRGKALELLDGERDAAVLEECALWRLHTLAAVVGMSAVVELVGGR